jgi:hypothetical protein
LPDFLGKKWTARLLVLAVVIGLLSVLPKIPHDQTLRIDLGDSSKITNAVTLRWAPISNDKKTDPTVEDWTGEVTFRYEKTRAPRIIEHQVHVTDGDYDVEIEVSTERGGAVMREIVALKGATTIDASRLAPTEDLRAEDGGTR